MPPLILRSSPAHATFRARRALGLLAGVLPVLLSSCAHAPEGDTSPAPMTAHSASVQAPAVPGPAAPAQPASSEAPYLTGAVQLTFPAKFSKAGEAYFDHQSPPQWIIFQAVPADSSETAYSMFVARLTRDASGNITGLDEPVRISAPGSANTCGWFHPVVPGMVLFASTVTAPSEQEPAGYSRDRQRYQWQFPKEMRIVTDVYKPITQAALDDEVNRDATIKRVTEWFNQQVPPDNPLGPEEAEKMLRIAAGQGKPGTKTGSELARPGDAKEGYMAEGSIAPDGRHVLFTFRDPASGEADLWVFDVRPTAVPRFTKVVSAPGYDGGGFFSPDGKRLCYRSDRQGNSELQIFVADLTFDAADPAKITGSTNERQLTSDAGSVNWAPYWSRDGQYLVYASSVQGHQNYELYALKVSDPSVRARVTTAPGFDGLPAFSDDGALLMWTSQRAGAAPGEARPSSQLWIAKVTGEPAWGR